MSVIGIDLGAYAVKVVVLHRVGRRWEVQQEEVELVREDERDPELGEGFAQLAALDRLLAAHPGWQAPTHEVIALWPAGKTTLRRLTMPFRDRAQIEQTLPFTVEGEVPFDMEDMVLGWRVIGGASTAATTSSVLAVLAPHDPLRDWLNELKRRSVNPKEAYIDADVLAALATDGAVEVIIDVGHARTLVSIVSGGVVQRLRSVDLGGRVFTETIAEGMGVSFDQAEAIKHGRRDADATESGLDPLPTAARTAVDQQVASWLAEVRASLIAAEDDLAISVERVTLVGGGAKLFGLRDYLEEDLGVPVLMPDDVDGAMALAHAGARVGARLRNVDAIELRRGDLVFRGGGDVLRTAALAMGAFVFCGTAVALVLFVWTYHSLGVQLDAIDQQIVDLVELHVEGVSRGSVSTTTAEPLLREKLTAAKTRAEMLGSADKPPHLSRILEVSEAIQKPPGQLVDVQRFSSSASNITFEAETDNYAASAAIEEALKARPCFSQASSKDKGKNRNKVLFSVSIPISPECGGEEEGS